MAIMYKNSTGGKPNPTFKCNEGAFTRNNEMETILGQSQGGSFASPMKKGMSVQIDTGEDVCVAPLSTGIPIGTLGSKPEGELPSASAAEHAYEKRIAPVDIDGELDWIQLKDTHAAVAPGTYLALDRSDASVYVVEEDTTTNVIALQTRAENETGYVLAFCKGPSQRAAD